MAGQAHDRPYLPGMGRHWLLPFYDPFTRLAGVPRLHEQLLDRAGLRSGQRVLEIGCGTGNLLTALGRRRLGVEALGIDPDPAALRRARRKAARVKAPIRYERAFADDLPVPDGSFDRVLSSLMLHHLDGDERIRALRETRRVLRPGGELHLVDVDGSQFKRGATDPRAAGCVPEQVLADLGEAGLTGAAENGRGRAWFGGFVFYRAGA